MKGNGGSVRGLLNQLVDRPTRTYYYDAPLSSRKPTYDSLRPASERFDAAGPYVEQMLGILLHVAGFDDLVAITLDDLALAIGIPTNRTNRLVLWRTIESLSRYRVLSITSNAYGDPSGHYRAPLVILEANVATEAAGHILTDVYEVTLLLNRTVLEDRQPLPMAALAGVS